MSAKERKMLRYGSVEFTQTADGVERKRQNRQRDGHQHHALDDVRYDDAPQSARRRIDENDAGAERDSNRKRHTQELRGDDSERVESDGIVEYAERNTAP